MAKPAVSMRTSGADMIMRKLDALPASVGPKTRADAAADAAEPIRKEMARLAPRGPGRVHIADHIVVSTDSTGAAAVGPSAAFFYAKFLEFGTVKMRARPFIRPAFDVVSPRAMAQLQRSLWITLREGVR